MRHRRGIDLTGGKNHNLPPKPTGIFFPNAPLLRIATFETLSSSVTAVG